MFTKIKSLPPNEVEFSGDFTVAGYAVVDDTGNIVAKFWAWERDAARQFVRTSGRGTKVRYMLLGEEIE